MLYGKNIRLRAIEREDLPHFVAWLNDPEVIRGLQIAWPLSMAQEENWFSHLLERPGAETPLGIEIEQAETWVLIGNVGLHNIDSIDRSAEIGIFIGEKTYWNQGYGTEAMRVMVRHGFNDLNLHRIFLRVYATNTRAIHSYEKAGFQHEGKMRDGVFRDGSYLDVVFMSVLQNEWKYEE
jgi:diamine N-acetyltransferase